MVLKKEVLDFSLCFQKYFTAGFYLKTSNKMSGSSRYFINRLDDFSQGVTVKVPKDTIRTQCLKYLQRILDQQGLNSKACDGGLYVGVAGVAYTFYRLSQHPDFNKDSQDLLAKCWHYLQPSLTYTERSKRENDGSAFLLGGAGVYAVAAAYMQAIGKSKESSEYTDQYVSLADDCLGSDYLGCGSDELFVGRAGYLAGALFLKKTFGMQILPREKMNNLCEAIVKSGTKYSRQHKSRCPLMFAYYSTEYLGAAHGLSSILQMLLCFPEFLDSNLEAEKRVKESIDYLLQTQTRSGNFPSATDEVDRPRHESHELVHWCHGAPGVVYLMAKAYLRWKEEKYLHSCLACGDLTWNKGLLKKGPGICHGVAGSGYVFLLLHRLTGDPVHLHRAVKFAEFLDTSEFIQGSRRPDCPFSLYEGLSGTVCFLADLLRPELAHFPFSDVF